MNKHLVLLLSNQLSSKIKIEIIGWQTYTICTVFSLYFFDVIESYEKKISTQKMTHFVERLIRTSCQMNGNFHLNVIDELR